MSDKQIQDLQEKIKTTFGDQSKLYEYLFETMDNFYYRYLETTLNTNLKTTSLGPQIWGAESMETSMVDALKVTQPEAKSGIMELAKTVPRAQGPSVRYGLKVKVVDLEPDQGELQFTALINWGFPDFTDSKRQLKKVVTLKYSDLGQYRKELAQKLEEVCQIFL